MKKMIACCVLALAIVVIGEPHVRGLIMDTAREWMHSYRNAQESTEEIPSFSDQIGSQYVTDMLDVTLYYRFEDTQLLGAMHAQLDIRREETVASSIVHQLIEGPAITHGRLSGLFPQGTELISVSGEETTAFVTLSRSFLGKPDGAPQDWEDLAAWQEEAALRRRLAVQSIILSLTEGGRYQRVQMYVADSDDDIPERIPMAYFDPHAADASAVLAASPRDESAMLTPSRAMQMIMDGWKARDYAAMYALLSVRQEEQMPTLNEFEAQMKEWDISLLTYETSDGTVSIDGRTATVVLDAQIRSNEGGDAQIIRESVPLYRERDNWVMATDTLYSLMIRD